MRRGRTSLRFALLLVAAGAWAQAPQRPPPQPAAAARPGAAGERSTGELRTTVWRGWEVTYEVIDGWAVHDGDILLGRVEEIEAAGARSALSGGGAPGSGQRRDALAVISDHGLWPGGVIPYRFPEDATDEERARVLAAMEDWSSRTVISFVPWTGQPEWLELRRGFPGAVCNASVGWRANSGGRHVSTVHCGFSTSVHELGHAIGLFHEHQRPDREAWGVIRASSRGSASENLSYGRHEAGSVRPMGPYDYRSIMDYGGAKPIPPGLLTGIADFGSSLSAGDVAGVNRLYGDPSEATLITTNPPGLEIVVDGRRVDTPATFHWPTGSAHVLEAPLWQGTRGRPVWGYRIWAEDLEFRYLYGRWNDGGDRVHDFTADPDRTWIEVSFIAQRWDGLPHRFSPSSFGPLPDEVNSEGRASFGDLFEGLDAAPRALSFVSDPIMAAPDARLIRLTNTGDRPERYSIVSNRPWLRAVPAEASLAPGASADIEVRAERGALGPEMHKGELRVLPASFSLAEAARLRAIPVAFVMLPEMVPVQLGAGGGTVEVAVSATEGFLGRDGRPVGRDGRVVSATGDAYVLTEGPGGITATFEPRSQTLDLPGGSQATLTQRGEGDWRIGDVRIANGYRYAAEGHEYVLEQVDGLWRAAPFSVRTMPGPDLEPGPALAATLNSPDGVAVDAAGNVYVAVEANHVVRKIDASGTITTVAGSGSRGYGGDNGPAVAAQLSSPNAVAVDAAGNVYVADTANHVVRKIDASGTITTVAGSGSRGYGGDNGPAVAAQLSSPNAVAVDAAGNVYVADTANHVVRKIDASGTITTVAGSGSRGYGGDNGPAVAAQLELPFGVAVDAAGNVYVADTANHVVRKIDASGTITTVAGSGSGGYGGDNGPAVAAQLELPFGVAVDAAGNVYVADTANHVVRKIDASGTITTVAGSGSGGYGGDNGPAVAAQLELPFGVAVDAAGNVYVADTANHVVRKIAAEGMISTLAGTGTAPPHPVYIRSFAVDAAGNVYYVPPGSPVVNRIDAAGTITRVAGTGKRGYSGDGGPATEGRLQNPEGVAVDAAGNVYVADHSGFVVRKIDAAGTITTFAGTGERPAGYGYIEVGNQASEAAFRPADVHVDAAGNVYVLHGEADNWKTSSIVGINSAGTIILTRDASGPAGILARPTGLPSLLHRTPAVAASFRSVGDSVHLPALDTRLRSMATDAVGNVYVTEFSDSGFWVHKLDAAGTGTVLALIRGFVWSIAAGGDGQLYAATIPDGSEPRVSTTGFQGAPSRIWRIDTRSGRVEAIAGDGDPWFRGRRAEVTAIAADPSGNLWAASDGRLTMVEPLPLPAEVTVRLPGGGAVRLSKREGGRGWRLGDTPVDDGHRYVLGDTEYVLGQVGDQWRVVSARVPLGGSGASAEVEVLTDGSLFHGATGRPLADGSLLTAPDFDNYTLSVGPDGLSAVLAPQQHQVALQGGGELRVAQDTDGTWRADGTQVGRDGYVFVGGRGYDLERVQGRWHASAGTRYSIRTVAGTTPAAEGVAASEAILFRPSGLATDAVGNLFIADTGNRRIRKVDVAGTIRTFAGTGMRGFSGDGGPAIQARLDSPGDLAVDGAGNLYFVEADRHSVRRIDAVTGVIETLAGTGDQGHWGDGGPASEAVFDTIWGLAADSAGNVYVADSRNSRVRRIDAATGTVESLAGPRGSLSMYWDWPAGLAVDGAGHVYVSQRHRGRVTRIDAATGAVESLAEIYNPSDLAIDAAGNLYVGWRDATVTKIAAVTRAREWSREFTEPQAVAVDAAGSVYVAEPGDHRVRRIDAATGTVTAFAGAQDPTGGWNGGPAKSARFSGPSSIAVDTAGTLFFIDSNRVWKLDASGMVTALASTGEVGYAGDGGPAGEAQLYSPGGLAVDAAGNVYVADTGNHRIRRIDAAGVITTVAGTGERGYSGDGGPAIEAALRSPGALAVDLAGNVYVADSGNDRVRKLDTAGTITTLAHDVDGVYSSARTDLAVDGAGNVFVTASHFGRALYRIDAATGEVAQERDYSGSSKYLGVPSLAADAFGSVYIFHGRHSQVKVISADGTDRVIAGNGRSGFSGDADRAAEAAVSVSDMVVDPSGAIWIADEHSRRIRVLEPSP